MSSKHELQENNKALNNTAESLAAGTEDAQPQSQRGHAVPPKPMHAMARRRRPAEPAQTATATETISQATELTSEVADASSSLSATTSVDEVASPITMAAQELDNTADMKGSALVEDAEGLDDIAAAAAVEAADDVQGEITTAEGTGEVQGINRADTDDEQQKPRRRAGMVVAKALGIAAIYIVSIVGLLFAVIAVITLGPFPTARDLFVVSVEETSAIKFTSRIYLSEEEVQTILQANTVIPITEVTDQTQGFEAPDPAEADGEDIEIHNVSGETFVGKMMIVRDPSRISLTTLDAFGAEVPGRRIEDFAADNNATAAINAGWFDDPGGVGLGGQPIGLLFSDGEMRNGSPDMVSSLVGFDAENRLIVGEMSGRQAMNMQIRDAVSLAPAIMPILIVNGTPAEFTGNGSGLNPRTAIGQRADGAVLMLVIDGRQPHSLGATLQDCQRLMIEFGAVNASMQDGGSSSVMVHEGETINVCASLYGSRAQPSAWIVH